MEILNNISDACAKTWELIPDLSSERKIARVLGCDHREIQESTTLQGLVRVCMCEELDILAKLKNANLLESAESVCLNTAFFLRFQGSHLRYFKDRDLVVHATGLSGQLQFYTCRILPCVESILSPDEPILRLLPDKFVREFWIKVLEVQRLRAENFKKGDHWKTALMFCLLDAVALGAKSVAIFESALVEYHYVTKNVCYRGKLSHEVCVGLSRLIEASGGMSLLEIFPFDQVSASVVQTSSGRVYSLSIGEGRNPVSDSTKHILLVDDDERFVRLLKQVLKDGQYVVHSVNSVQKALLYRMREGFHVDLLICDYHMPEMTGGDLVNIIRSHDDPMPIVVLTSDTSKEVRVRLIESGADAVLAKNSNPEILFREIASLVES